MSQRVHHDKAAIARRAQAASKSTGCLLLASESLQLDDLRQARVGQQAARPATLQASAVKVANDLQRNAFGGGRDVAEAARRVVQQAGEALFACKTLIIKLLPQQLSVIPRGHIPEAVIVRCPPGWEPRRASPHLRPGAVAPSLVGLQQQADHFPSAVATARVRERGHDSRAAVELRRPLETCEPDDNPQAEGGNRFGRPAWGAAAPAAAATAAAATAPAAAAPAAAAAPGTATAGRWHALSRVGKWRRRQTGAAVA
eukprot:CAMPEP_0179119114 /NCGR_PEP_ID=MMETSP0796-20121207/56058_1 /TAXON_ID=73915 /ORGANISM="Pyrodinium bahamense, Strain pbaha01" /LENGTH=256 /DNA_ID=CAMNT_0020817605 /DNA_START=141 /DNA_END=908 /DNA_ORIENTATION=+